MQKDLQDFITKIENAVRRLPYANKDGFVDTLHLVEVYCEISDLLIDFDIEQYQESSSSEDESSEED